MVRVRLRYPDLETFVDKFAPNVTRGGIFLASRDPRPVGEVLRFEVMLRQGPAVLSGEGRVTWVKPYNAAEPYRPYGMGVQFIYVDPHARPVLERLLERKNARRPPTPAAGTAAGSSFDARPITTAFMATASAADLRDEDMDDAAMRRVLERARALSARTDDLDALLAPETEPQFTRAQALAELPTLLAGRRSTGHLRVLEAAKPEPQPEPEPEPQKSAPKERARGLDDTQSDAEKPSEATEELKLVPEEAPATPAEGSKTSNGTSHVAPAEDSGEERRPQD